MFWCSWPVVTQRVTSPSVRRCLRRAVVSRRPRQSLSSLAAAVKEVEEIPAYLPSGAALKDAVQKAKDWLQEVEGLQVRKRPLGE